MRKQNQISNVIFNLSNNFITIGGKRPNDSSKDLSNCQKATDSLNHSENILTSEVMNELLHLPFDTILIPFLKKIGIQTKSKDCDDVLHTGVLDIINGYLKPSFKSHKDGHSVQPDTTVVIKDCVIYFEFKNPLPTPSKNKHSLIDFGRQILLAYKHMQDYGVNNYKIILISNSAPKVYIEREGLVNPSDIVARYFTEQPDTWMQKDYIKKIAETVDRSKLKDSFIVLNWADIFEHALATVEEAVEQYTDKNIKAMILNAYESLTWYKERRQQYFSKYNT